MKYDVKTFEQDVLKRSQQIPVLVDFWAPWCGPCKTLGPILEKLAAEAQGRWELVKINTEENEELAMAFDIRSIPAVKLFHQGKVVNEFLGALPEPQVRQWLNQALPSPNAEVLAKAKGMLAGGRASEAAARLEPVVASEPANEPARLLLAECCLVAQPQRVADLLTGIGLESEFADKAAALRTLARIADVAEHPDQLAEAPVRARYVEGAKAAKKGDYAKALAAFIEVLQRQRDYDNEGAKAACKAIFQHLGIRHPISEQFHRAFSSALHS